MKLNVWIFIILYIKNGISGRYVSEIIYREMIRDEDTGIYTVDEKANPIFVN